MARKVLVGVVTGDKMAKTRRVDVNRRVRHPIYGKYIRRRTVCYVHDEDEECGLGDTVEIRECRPRSKQKRWELVRIVSKSTEVDLQALRAAQQLEAEERERQEREQAAAEAAAPATATEVAAEESEPGEGSEE